MELDDTEILVLLETVMGVLIDFFRALVQAMACCVILFWGFILFVFVGVLGICFLALLREGRGK